MTYRPVVTVLRFLCNLITQMRIAPTVLKPWRKCGRYRAGRVGKGSRRDVEFARQGVASLSRR
jgi:hypothetical protein